MLKINNTYNFNEIIKLDNLIKCGKNNLFISILIFCLNLITICCGSKIINSDFSLLLLMLLVCTKIFLYIKFVINLKNNSFKNNFVAFILLMLAIFSFLLPIGYYRSYIKFKLHKKEYWHVINEVEDNYSYLDGEYNISSKFDSLSINNQALIYGKNPLMIVFIINGNATTSNVAILYVENDNIEKATQILEIQKFNKIENAWYYIIY